jgi:hypothetical protein
MEADDDIRSNQGVVCCLRELGEGKLRLVMDDVSNESKTTSGPWEHSVLFTWQDFEELEIMELELSEKKLAEIGLNVLVRLVALRKRSMTKEQ